MAVRMETAAVPRKLNYKTTGSNGSRGASYNPAAAAVAAAAAGNQLKASGPRAPPAPMATQHSYSRAPWSQQPAPYTYRYQTQPLSHNTNSYSTAANANANTTPYNTQSYGSQRVPTAASPSNTNSSSSSNTGSQSGTMSTSLSNTVGQSGNNQEQLSKTNLYIRGLTQSTTDKDLVSMCAQFGTIISTKAILDKNTNKCKGYGFVDFESPAAAEGAVKALQAKGIQAQMAKVGIWFLRRSPTVRFACK